MSNRLIMSLLLILLAGCAGEFTPITPVIAPSSTATIPTRPPSATPDAPALRDVTEPPTFTPTYTPTITPTRTITPTPAPPSAEELCASFYIRTGADGARYTASAGGVLFQIGSDYRVNIRLRILMTETDELFAEGDIAGGRQRLIFVELAQFPQSGQYTWETALIDEEHGDFCEYTGNFIVELPEPVEITPETTEAAEVTPEIVELTPETTEAVEVTPEIVELTPEITESVEVTPEIVELMPEVTEAVEVTPEISELTPEVTETATD